MLHYTNEEKQDPTSKRRVQQDVRRSSVYADGQIRCDAYVRCHSARLRLPDD